MNPRFAVLSIAFLLTMMPPVARAGDANAEWRWRGIARVVVVPDVHGAYPELQRLLKATGLVDESLSWVGGKSHLVSLGDLLDRGAESRAVMDLLMRLQGEAAGAGGRVHVLLGNHELMNLIGDLRYVSKAEYAAFSREELAQERTSARERFTAANPTLDAAAREAAFEQRYPPGYFAHRAAFRLDGLYGNWLASLPAMVVIDDSAFVHGGLPGFSAEPGAARLNEDFTRDLRNYLTLWRQLVDAEAIPDEEPDTARDLVENGLLATPSDCVEERAAACEQIPGDAALGKLVAEFRALSDAPVLRNDSPLWYRGTVYCRDILERPGLDAEMQRLGVRRLVVGHTPTGDGRVHLIRDGRVVMADTGMLVSYYKGRPAALVFEQGGLHVQYLDPEERGAPVIGWETDADGLDAAAVGTALATGDVVSVERPAGEGPWTVVVEAAGKSLRASFYPDTRKHPDAMELAAAALDELLGTELVPPTVPRIIGNVRGALQLDYPDTISERQRRERGLGFPGWCPMQPQLQLMYAFDLLTDNRARSAESLRYRQTSGTLYLVDHGAAFSSTRRIPAQLSPDVLQAPPGIIEALSRLDEASVETALGQWLDHKRIAALLARRDRLLEALAGG